MSYIEFFEFKDHPFRITPDVAFFYSSPSHMEALESLKYFADSNEGFMVMTGEPGTGKTITLRKFLNEAPDNIETAYVLFPSLEPEDMFRAVLEDFGYKINTRQSKNALFSGFRDFLMEKKAQGKKIILVVDEAQNLPNRTLEELRILSNLETETDKLIQFILAGQPELDKKLNSEELRQLKQRVTIFLNLKYMNVYEISKYVSFRLSKAGFQGQYPDKEFYTELFSISRGNPRLVNLLMERTLMSAYVDQSKTLSGAHLNNAAVSLKLRKPGLMPRLKYIAAALLVSAAVVAGSMYAYNRYSMPKWVVPQAKAQTQQPVQKPAEQKAAMPETQPAQETDAAQVKAEKPKNVEIIDVGKQPETTKQANVQPEPEKTSGYIAAGVLNVRSGPGKQYDVSAKLKRGAKVSVKKRDAEWMLVSFKPMDGVSEGWLHKDYVIFAK
ncbi:MAG: AAA family ATPase [Deferribacterales bacterium]